MRCVACHGACCVHKGAEHGGCVMGKSSVDYWSDVLEAEAAGGPEMTVPAWPEELVRLFRESDPPAVSLLGVDGTYRAVLDARPAFSPAHVAVRFVDDPGAAVDVDRACEVTIRVRFAG